MTIHQCDKCTNKLEAKGIVISIGLLGSGVELCKQCAEPVIVFLRAHQRLQERLRQEKLIPASAELETD